MFLKELRLSKDYTQSDLAIKLGVHFQTIQAWESGKTEISDKWLVKLSTLFDYEFEYMVRLKYGLKKDLQSVDIAAFLKEISNSLKIIANNTGLDVVEGIGNVEFRNSRE